MYILVHDWYLHTYTKYMYMYGEKLLVIWNVYCVLCVCPQSLEHRVLVEWLAI